mgnify:CR=1 FL=1
MIGILADTGTGLGINMSDALIIPVANAMQLFNTEGLFRVMIDVRSVQAIPALISNIEQQMTMLHDGQLDVTVTTPDSLLAAFDNILLVLTLAIAGIGGISLIVAGVLIMNMTVISVSQRSAEIGLLKALGASSNEVKALFITEAAMLAVCGATLGLAIAELCLWLARQQFPDVPFNAPWWASITAVGVAAEQRTLWPAQHLHALHFGEVRFQKPIGGLPDAIDVNADAGQAPDIERRRSHPATLRVGHQVRYHDAEILPALDAS